MGWSDTALMLSVTRKSETELRLNLLTRNHGRRTCSLTLDPSEIQLLLPGCELNITGQVTGTAGLVDVQILDVTHGIMPQQPETEAILVVRHINEALTDLLPPSEPHQTLFALSIVLVRAMEVDDPRWPIYFVQWEVAVLDALGQMRRFNRCKSDFRHGESIYISRKTGKVATREEAGAFLDRFEPVPSMIMGAQNGSAEDVQRAYRFLSMLFESYLGDDLSRKRIFRTRDDVGAKLMELTYIPLPEAPAKGMFVSEEARKKKRLALQPLTVGAGSVSFG